MQALCFVAQCVIMLCLFVSASQFTALAHAHKYYSMLLLFVQCLHFIVFCVIILPLIINTVFNCSGTVVNCSLTHQTHYSITLCIVQALCFVLQCVIMYSFVYERGVGEIVYALLHSNYSILLLFTQCLQSAVFCVIILPPYY